MNLCHHFNWLVYNALLAIICQVKAGTSYHSCCVVVKNTQRCVYAIPNGSVFNNEMVLKLEKDIADSKISTAAFRSKLHVIF